VLEVEGELRLSAEAILSSRVGDSARTDEFDGYFPPGFVSRQKNYARPAMIDHALQSVTHVDRVGDRLDAP
jgi:hypothetical protein